MLGSNSKKERIATGRLLLEQLHDSRYSEYAEWLRIMFRLYDGVPQDRDPLDPASFDLIWEAVDAGNEAAPRASPAILGPSPDGTGVITPDSI